jgi:outer membrane protein
LSLEDCIDYALKNNISLKQSALNIELNKTSYLQSKLQLLPSVNLNSSFNKNQGRYINPLTNEFIEQVSSSINLSYSSNVTLFNGFKNLNQIKKAANELLKSIYDLESAKNELISTVALGYLQILFNEELYLTAGKQWDLTKIQETRIQILLDAGSVARGELLNIQSQIALEEQQLIQAENQLNMSKLQLAQLLEIQNYQDFKLVAENIEIPTFQITENIEYDYKKALSLQSTVKSSELAVNSALYDYKTAKANYLPTLSLSQSASSLYSDNAQDMFTFNEQIDNNLQSGLFLNLSIPLFNK